MSGLKPEVLRIGIYTRYGKDVQLKYRCTGILGQVLHASGGRFHL